MAFTSTAKELICWLLKLQNQLFPSTIWCQKKLLPWCFWQLLVMPIPTTPSWQKWAPVLRAETANLLSVVVQKPAAYTFGRPILVLIINTIVKCNHWLPSNTKNVFMFATMNFFALSCLHAARVSKYGLHFASRNRFSAEMLATFLAANQWILNCQVEATKMAMVGLWTLLTYQAIVALGVLNKP